MRDHVDSFLNHLVVERGFSKNTLEAYRNDLYQLIDFIRARVTSPDGAVWRQVNLDLLTDYVSTLRGKRGYRESTTARKVAAIKSFFNFLVQESSIEEDPTELLISPKVGRHLPQYLTEEEMERLLDHPSETKTPDRLRDLAILELLYATGLRVSELVSLNLHDLNLKEGYIRCLGKGSRERIVYLYPRAAEVLGDYKERARPQLVKRKEEGALFLNRRGERLTRQWVWSIIKKSAKEAGIDKPITPHVLRHSYATHMLRGGASLRHVQEMLGHASITTTQVYTHLTDDYVRQEYDSSHPRS